MERLEERIVLAVDAVDFVGETDSWTSLLSEQLDTAISAANGLEAVGLQLPGLGETIEGLSDFKDQVDMVGADLREAEQIYRDNTADALESFSGFISELATITAPANSVGYTGISFDTSEYSEIAGASGPDRVEFQLNFSVAETQALMIDVTTVAGIDLNLGFDAAVNIDFTNQVDLELRVVIDDTMAGDDRFRFVPGSGGAELTTVQYTPSLDATPLNASGQIASLVDFDATLSASFAPQFNFDTGPDIGGVDNSVPLSDFASALADNFDAGSDIIDPLFVFTARIELDPASLLPDLGYQADFTLDLSSGATAGPLNEQILVDSNDVTTEAGQQALLASVIGEGGAEVFENFGDVIPEPIRNLLLGQVEIIAGTELTELIQLVSGNVYDTPIDLLGLAAQSLAGVPMAIFDTIEIIVKAADFADTVSMASSMDRNEQFAFLAELRDDYNIIFPIVDDPATNDIELSMGDYGPLLASVKELLKGDQGQPVNLALWQMDIGDHPQVRDLPQSVKDLFIKTQPNAFGQDVEYLFIQADASKQDMIDWMKDTISDNIGGFVGNLIAEGVELMIDQLGGIDFEFGFEFLFGAQLTAGADTSFLIEPTLNGLADSFFIGTGDLLNIDFEVDFSARIDAGDTPIGQAADFVADVGSCVVTLGQDCDSDVVEDFAYAEFGIKTEGNFSFGLKNSAGADPAKLRLSDIAGGLGEHLLIDGGLSIAFDVHVKISGIIDGNPSLPAIELLPFAADEGCIDMGGFNGAGGAPDNFAELNGDVLQVYGSSTMDIIDLYLDTDINRIIARRNGKELGFNPADVNQIIVDLRGGILTRVDPGTDPMDGGDDSVLFQASLPSDILATVHAGTGNTTMLAHDGLGNFFPGDVVFLGFTGMDTLVGGGGTSFLFGGDANDVLQAGLGASDMRGGKDDDQLYGLGGSSGLMSAPGSGGLMIGGDGKDRLEVGSISSGDFTLIGGSIGPSAADAGNILIGGSGNDLLIGGDATPSGATFDADLNSGFSSLLLGGPGNDSLFGTKQGDTLIGGALGYFSTNGLEFSGIDTLTGGPGDDGLIVSNAITLNTPLRIVPIEVDQAQGDSMQEIADGGAGHDTFLIGNNSAEVSALGGTGDDLFAVSSDVQTKMGTVDEIQGLVNIDGGADKNFLWVNDSAGGGNSDVIVTRNTISGLAGADIQYEATGNFEFNDDEGILIFGSDVAADTFTIRSTLAGSKTKIRLQNGADMASVGSAPADDNGNLDDIESLLTIISGGDDDYIYINDRSNAEANNYRVEPTQVIDDPDNPSDPPRSFAGVVYDSTTEQLRLDGTDDVNEFSVRPSPWTTYTIDGNLPSHLDCIPGGGDFLKLDLDELPPVNPTLVTGPRATFTEIVNGRQTKGRWDFDPPHQSVSFESIERFNLLDKLVLGSDAGLTADSVLKVLAPRDGSDFGNVLTNFVDPEIQAFESNFRGGVRVTTADMNCDGIEEIIAASGAGRAPEVRIFNGLDGSAMGTGFPGDPAYLFGINVAAGDIDFDGMTEILTSQSRNSTEIKIWDFDGLDQLTFSHSIDSKFGANFIGGVTVASGDINGDGQAEIIASVGTGQPTQIKVFDNQGAELQAFAPANRTELGPLKAGIAAIDNASGSGFVLFSEESLFDRLSPPPIQGSALHLIAVRQVGGQWMYDNNGGLHPFKPRPTDVLVAEVDFGSDAVTMLDGIDQSIDGIQAGYVEGNLLVTANRFDGRPNFGEFELSGSFIERHAPKTLLGNTHAGVAARDGASGTGFLLYSEENLFQRFAASPPVAGNADHLIAVVFDGQWRYDNNGSLVPFTPRDSDILVAELDFSANTATVLEGVNDIEQDIVKGYQQGDLTVIAEQFNGSANAGEFDILGTFIQRNEAVRQSLGSLHAGIAARDNSQAEGFILYSEQNLFERFAAAPPVGGNAEHLIGVVYEGGQWFYDNNASLLPFSPMTTDLLVAAVDFGTDQVQLLQGIGDEIHGIASGYTSGNLMIIPNQFDGAPNGGEFGVEGSFVYRAPLGGGANLGGSFIDVGDVDGDGLGDIVVSGGRREASRLSIFAGQEDLAKPLTMLGSTIHSYTDPSSLAPVSVALKDADGDCEYEIFTGQLSDGETRAIRRFELEDAVDELMQDFEFLEIDARWGGFYLG